MGEPEDVDPGMSVPAPPFATVDDLESRWHALTSEERARAQVLIEDAADVIMTQCPRWYSASPATLKRITCAMVKRAMSSPDYGGADVTQASQSVGQVSIGLTYSNPNGSLFLYKDEKKALGVGVQRFWSIDLSDGKADTP